MHQMGDEMRRCIEKCLGCHRVCVTEASQHCLGTWAAIMSRRATSG